MSKTVSWELKRAQDRQQVEAVERATRKVDREAVDKAAPKARELNELNNETWEIWRRGKLALTPEEFERAQYVAYRVNELTADLQVELAGPADCGSGIVLTFGPGQALVVRRDEEYGVVCVEWMTVYDVSEEGKA